LNLNKYYSYKDETSYDDEFERADLPTGVSMTNDVELQNFSEIESAGPSPSRR